VEAWKVRINAREQRIVVPRMSVSLTFNMEDGSTETWTLSGRVIAKPSKNVKGSKEAGSISWEICGQEYDQTL
jgi:RNase P/RNase MRP subunit p29